jgi:hypothetical protein
MTGMAGMPLYLDLLQRMGLYGSIGRHVRVKEGRQGWSDPRVILSYAAEPGGRVLHR